MCVFSLSSQLNLSAVSVVFDFNDSLSDVASVSLKKLPLIKNAKEEFVDGCHLCVFFLLSSLIRVSLVSVVFDFNDSHNGFAPVFLMSIPTDSPHRNSHDTNNNNT